VIVAAMLAVGPGLPSTARAQAEPDSAAADTTLAPPAEAPPARRATDPELAKERDRFELGAAVVTGPFDVLGTVAYRRFLRGNASLEHWAHVEMTGGKESNIRELSASAAYLLRPVHGIRRSWPVRPIFEFGPAVHIVAQVADIEGFGESAFHTHGYLKTHAFAGFDFLLGSRLGVVARGRFSVPSHHPFDYAQIALFLR
jgi:hypothetical protein